MVLLAEFPQLWCALHSQKIFTKHAGIMKSSVIALVLVIDIGADGKQEL
jgi:hypothetical protein